MSVINHKNLTIQELVKKRVVAMMFWYAILTLNFVAENRCEDREAEEAEDEEEDMSEYVLMLA